MASIEKTHGLYVEPAKIISVDAQTRTVNVSWLSQESGAQNVPVLTDPGSFAMPKVGEHALILVAGNLEYYLGKLEYNYKKKIGLAKDPETGETVYAKDAQTGEKIIAKEVKGGEVFLSNLAKRAWLSITNAGDFGILNGLNEGLKYFTKGRIMRLAAMTIRFAGNGLKGALGSTVRDLPGKGATVITEGTAPTVEAFLEIAKAGVKIARAHIGEVKDTTLGAVPDKSSYGSSLRVLFQALTGDVPLAELKLDEAGNAELLAKTGKAAIDGIEVQLGGISAGQQVIKGNQYTGDEIAFLTQMNVFLAALTTFVTVFTVPPTSSIIPAAGAAAGTFLPLIVNFQTAVAQFQAKLPASLSPKVKTV